MPVPALAGTAPEHGRTSGSRQLATYQLSAELIARDLLNPQRSPNRFKIH
jgi:hypothetical protein